MSGTMSKNEAQPGPYDYTETRTIELSAPVKITITRAIKSSHVPQAGCGCGGGGLNVADILSAVRQATADLPDDPEPDADPEPHAH